MVVVAVLLCVGVCLSLLVSGSEGPSVLGMTNVVHVDQGANGNAPPLDGTYLFFTLPEEAEETDNSPVNAGLLTMLSLAVFSYFGGSARWQLTNAQGQGPLCFSLGVVGEVLGSNCEDYLPFLGVFRL